MQRPTTAIAFICASLIILSLQAGVSNAQGQSGKATYLDSTSIEDFPSAAARISNLVCRVGSGGTIFSFEIEVFEEAWCPIYSIQIEHVGPSSLEPVGCPSNWTAISEGFDAGGKVVFMTSNSPLLPGTCTGKFTLRSSSNHILIRWYPGDADRVLIGKITREEFSCPTTAQSETWGLIKAIYGKP